MIIKSFCTGVIYDGLTLGGHRQWEQYDQQQISE